MSQQLADAEAARRARLAERARQGKGGNGPGRRVAVAAWGAVLAWAARLGMSWARSSALFRGTKPN